MGWLKEIRDKDTDEMSRLVIEECKFTFTFCNDVMAKEIAIKIQFEKIVILKQYGINSDYEKEILTKIIGYEPR